MSAPRLHLEARRRKSKLRSVWVVVSGEFADLPLEHSLGVLVFAAT
jgi:hypothetical protein